MGRLDMGLAHYLGGLPTLQPAHDTTTYSIRLYGINAPELNATDPEVRAAAQASRDNLAALLPAGAYIKIVSYHFDKYSMRIDAIPYALDGTDCCQAQLDGGFAVPYNP